ncbi:MAG: acyl-[ACP]--phospholipid O-acyltransferase [Hyphomicrobiaceae bacterium]|nr:acyl-[ACP]--phospholipid O-acyltransferase [Hyphomicrobiaceae bacterium]MCC0008705.1 acyl-[ACP]--phospholipid O-acyltransferase [Hyphomicrobiaceae bacterium]
MSAALMRSRRFAPMFWTQFLSALSDNFVKNALVMLIVFQIGGTAGAQLVALAGGVFILPFFILSGLGGELADRYDKALMARRLKLAEIPVAGIAALGFVLHSVPVLFVALAAFGVIGALFSPIKYGILPVHLETRELPAGNALVEGATFLAILAGTIAGGYAVANGIAGWPVVAVVLALAVMCYLASRFIPETGEAAPHLAITRNPVTSTVHLLRDLRKDRRIWIGAMITSWFWLVGAVALSLLPSLMKDLVGGTQSVITLALVVFTVGIAVGSGLAAAASKMRPNLALVPLGALLMGLFSLDLGWAASGIVTSPTPLDAFGFLASPTGVRICIDLLGLAIAGGLFIVPSFASVQAWAPADRRARVIAGVNVLNAAFMTASAVALMGLQAIGVGLGGQFAILGVGSLVTMGLVMRAWGREGLQDLILFLYRLFLGVEVEGREHLPKEGDKAIIAPNHVSLLDAGLMYALLPSHAGFAIDTGMADKWWVKPFLKLAKTWTIDPTRPLGTRSLINHVKNGETLVIFPEGRLTVTGGLMKVYDGTAMIADKADAPIVPVRIDGLERSKFGYLNRYQTKKVWFPKTRVTILPPVKLDVDPDLKGRNRRQAAGARLQDIMVESAVKTAPIHQTLFEALVLARNERDTGKPAVEDPMGTALSYKKLILGAQVLGRKLAPLAAEGANIGVMLPNSAGAAVTFFALQSIGRVPAMLNFTAGAQSIAAACRAAEVGVVLTSRAFVEKARLSEVIFKLEENAKIVYLEDVKAEITLGDKIAGLRQGSRPQVARKPDQPAAILFTSGSEGTPKGVVLSHTNILANATQSLTRVAVNGSDKVFNVLPVFHSFGLTAGLVMPLVAGVPVYLYPSPLHYRIVPELVYGSNATILFGTDTFLNGYARAAHPYDFARVRLILAGAEAVKERTRQIYMEKFGVRILEGYGVTETAPVLAINTPLANKSGTVGRLSPLMEARLEPVPGIEEGGRLYVRGPNVMLGYLRAENPGVLEPPHNGWHDTGDIVTIDAQGFIKIRGRAKRFAKIGGEMISLSVVEAAAAELWPAVISVVVSVPDQRKGERLVLLTANDKATRADFQAFAKSKGINELSVPAEVMVAPVPLLGSGKPDYVTATKLVREKLGLDKPAAIASTAAA